MPAIRYRVTLTQVGPGLSYLSFQIPKCNIPNLFYFILLRHARETEITVFRLMIKNVRGRKPANIGLLSKGTSSEILCSPQHGAQTLRRSAFGEL